MRLAVKYQLHPLPVEDTIQLLGSSLCSVQRQRLQQQSVPLVRSYGDNFFIILPMLRLTTPLRRTSSSRVSEAFQKCAGEMSWT